MVPVPLHEAETEGGFVTTKSTDASGSVGSTSRRSPQYRLRLSCSKKGCIVMDMTKGSDTCY